MVESFKKYGAYFESFSKTEYSAERFLKIRGLERNRWPSEEDRLSGVATVAEGLGNGSALSLLIE